MQKIKIIYKLVIGDGLENRLKLSLSEDEFKTINLCAFIELGFIVTVCKLKEYGEVQNP